ncbi:hypothetical protein GPECTOR_56g387 [Gonium pectorale]|uniref:Exostosin GT47 domain-containing protein n=1 Tax=Gonium pectorale TaxID=33097 RepID=A0A150G632_GONPE|nr:hypothetical protein GPECTOR_56g387 [Gonium pectorale]|eukprot:KXZ45291.1 hypothetical protein GPECTOR_56g387 [Gonium pectorale]
MPNNVTWPACGDKSDWYSGGIREKVHVYHWNRTGFRVVRSEPRYDSFLARSQFCLAPPGAGHGQRQIQALFMGCLPVTIADHVAEPFEPSVSWDDWGLRVAERDIPRLHELLDAVTPEQRQAKRARMYCAAQHMLYSSITGSVMGEDGRYDAFESTLEVLRVKALHPTAPPQDYRRLDPDFDAFMDCRDPPGFTKLTGREVESLAVMALTAAGAAGQVGSGEITGAEMGAELEQGQEGEVGVEGGGGGVGGADDADAEWGVAAGAAEAAAAAGFAAPPPASGAGNATGNSTGPPPLVLCSHAARDMHRRERSCYYLLRGTGYMGVPGGALCARGHRYHLASCPRLWG